MKLWKLLTALLAGVGSFLVIALQRLKLKQTKEELKREKAKSESITRQVKANREQKLKAWGVINEAKSQTNTAADINRVLRKRSRRNRA